MHIVLLSDHALPTSQGGAAVVVDNLRREFTGAGHQVTLITTHQKENLTEEVRTKDDLGEVISIYVNYPPSQRHRKCLRNPAITTKLRTLFKELCPDVVHAHVIHMYLTYESLQLASEVTNRIFLTAHDTFLVSFNRIKGPSYWKAVRQNKVPRLHWWTHLLGAGRKYWPLRNNKILSILNETNTTVICISTTLETLLNAHGIQKTTVIHNGTYLLDTPQQSQIDEWRNHWNLDGPTILSGGRISTDKGMDVLLAAMPYVLDKIPNANLLIVGEKERLDPHLNNLPAAVMAAVRPTGWVSRDEMQMAYACADLVTTPSIYMDAFNLINIEAMAASKPVAGSCYGGIPEIVHHNTTGYICDPLDSEKFGAVLIKMLLDHKASKKMGHKGRDRVNESFNITIQARKHLTLFNSD